MTNDDARGLAGGRSTVAALAVGLVGAAGLAVGWSRDPSQAAHSYLVAFAYLLSVPVGALALLMAFHAAGAIWPVLVRRLIEAVVAALPVCAVLFVPVALGAGHLYPWMHPAAVADAEQRQVLLHKLPAYGFGLWVGRAAVYLVVLALIGGLLRRWSLAGDRAGAPLHLERQRALSSAGLPLVAIVGTLAAWDWLMSLSPDWTSTMFGLYYLCGGFLAALALLPVLTVFAARQGYLRGVTPAHHHALGRLLFAFLVFWAYTAYWQYMLSYIANRPAEARWFADRLAGAYRWPALFLVVGHFALPFFALLSYRAKHRPRLVAGVGAWILAAHYFDVHWLVAAARGRETPLSWLDLAALAAVAGLALAFALWRQSGRALVAHRDPRLAEALAYGPSHNPRPVSRPT
jgi:hypothetical protein